MELASWRAPLFFFILFFTFSSLGRSAVKSLQLKLIHRDSPYSPLWPGNLTADDRMRRLLNYSDAYSQLVGLQRIRPKVTASTFFYLVELVVGTRRDTTREPVKYHLVMDTGSDLMWLHCEPCEGCGEPINPPFNPGEDSNTYHPLPCNHHLCEEDRPDRGCKENRCQFNIGYDDGKMTTSGELATDVLEFAAADHSGTERVPNLVFGCGHKLANSNDIPEIDGTLGLDLGGASLASQVAGGHRFSYCLPPYSNPAQPPTSLMIGDDAVIRARRVQSIPFVHVPEMTHYYLDLVDVSIANKRVGFKPDDFAVRKSKGGFAIDSGAPITEFMRSRPFMRIRAEFKKYFNAFKELEEDNGDDDYEDYVGCYKTKSGRSFRKLPSMTLHFRGGKELVIDPKGVVVILRGGKFCVNIRKTNDISVFGAYQQQNYRFSFDLDKRELSYVKEDCTRVG